MAFDIKTLVTDRTQADVDTLRAKIQRGLTPEELAEFLKAGDKGAYNYTDLNRVNAACVYLRDELKKYGYTVDVQLPQIEDVVPGETVLPEGYVELSYIESTGTQYIDTGFKPNNNTRVVVDAQYTNASNSNPALFGARTAATSKNYAILYTGSIRSDYNNVYTQTWNIPPTDRYVYDKNKETTTINGDKKSYTNSAFQCDYNLFLFALNQGGKAQWYSNVKLYSCKIYDNGVLIRDFVPCRNNANTVGLYDSVGKKFYGNSGTGSFVEGETVGTQTKAGTRDYWKDGDIPTNDQLTRYLLNVENIRNSIGADGTGLPQSMNRLNYEQANRIEEVLKTVTIMVERIMKGFRKLNSFMFISGALPFPSATEVLARNWGELDKMQTTWRNWQVVSWFGLLYSSMTTEGDVV